MPTNTFLNSRPMAKGPFFNPPFPPATLDISVVAPAHNEQDNIEPLVREIEAALAPSRLSSELVILDDGSTDQTRAKLTALQATNPRLRVVAMTNTPPGKGNGQSAAFHAGFRATKRRAIAVLDADLQTNPSENPAMFALLHREKADLVQFLKEGLASESYPDHEPPELPQ